MKLIIKKYQKNKQYNIIKNQKPQANKIDQIPNFYAA